MICKDCLYCDVCKSRVMQFGYGFDENQEVPKEGCGVTIDGFVSKADYVEVKHGEWIRHEPNPEKMRAFHNQGIGVAMAENSIYWTCSICGDWGVPHNKYCRECGAKMDG